MFKPAMLERLALWTNPYDWVGLSCQLPIDRFSAPVTAFHVQCRMLKRLVLSVLKSWFMRVR